MTTHTLKQCRPDHKETEYFWKLFHAAQRNDARWHGSEIEFIAEELSRTDLDRNQKLFLLRAWQVLIDDKGGFGRFMGAFDTYVYNMQDPNDECVSWKPELSKLLHDGVLLGVVLEAYDEALQGIAGLSMENVALALTIEKCREIVGCSAGVDLQDHLRQLAAENVGLKSAITDHSQSVHFCEVCGKDDPCSTDDVCYVLNETPATDRIYAGIKANAFEEAAVELERVDTIASTRVIALKLREFAKQLREGASE
ncbi:hypothetical protein ACQKFC_05575 [Raoultella planticola]|uniref:hypothetical protein n=1 Tax=Raoultella planticola TaxID=575 RepID=UPI003CFD96FB